MNGRRVRLALLGLAVLALISVFPVLAASIPVPATNAGRQVSSIGTNDLKPSDCSSITVTTKVTGSGNFNGTSGADLITGSSGDDSPNGLNGGDCILGGGGDDTLTGGGGTDVCIGGPGTDSFNATCETQIQ